MRLNPAVIPARAESSVSCPESPRGPAFAGTTNEDDRPGVRRLPKLVANQVNDKAMLDKVKTGDKIRFAADIVAGALSITQMELAK